MDFIRHPIPDIVEIRPRRMADARGHFAETFKRSAFEAEGLVSDFPQENRSLSTSTGTIRGLHFQRSPHAQAKLVTVAKGAILDVAVDIRRASPTFGRHVALRLDADNGVLLFVPEGFAHGFCTLEAGTEVIYKVSRPWDAASERSIHFADPALGIDWPVDMAKAVLSEKDASAPRLAETADLF